MHFFFIFLLFLLIWTQTSLRKIHRTCVTKNKSLLGQGTIERHTLQPFPPDTFSRHHLMCSEYWQSPASVANTEYWQRPESVANTEYWPSAASITNTEYCQSPAIIGNTEYWPRPSSIVNTAAPGRQQRLWTEAGTSSCFVIRWRWCCEVSALWRPGEV